ncbi:MAG: hypothetical protein ACM3KH_00035 [Thiobacillus sp.]
MEEKTPNPTQPQQPPVQQWQQTPPEAAKVQYVVAQKSLDGIGGWLAFWLVVFALNGIGYISIFFNQLNLGVSSAEQVVSVIFSPILAVAFLASVVLIAMRKKLGMWVSMGTVGLATVYAVINSIISGADSSKMGTLIGGILIQLVFGGLIALYFFQSKRVKATLVG